MAISTIVVNFEVLWGLKHYFKSHETSQFKCLSKNSQLQARTIITPAVLVWRALYFRPNQICHRAYYVMHVLRSTFCDFFFFSQVLVFCPLLTNKTHPAGGIVQAGVGEALGLLALWPPTVTHAVGVPPGVRCVSGVPSLATAITSSRTFSRIAPSISGQQYSPQPRDFGDHEKAEGPPRGERRKLPITLSRQAKTQKSWLSIPGRPPLRSTPALVPWCGCE